MGSERTNDEKPVHRVSVNDFYIGETEVTQELWRAVMGTNPSKRLGTQRPVESISFNDCETFVNKLNTLTGMNFRIPTEEEWEFAARGGTSSRGYKFAGSDDCNTVSWNSSNSNEDTHNVKMRSPNELGIYDMSGNVQEWVYSYWSDGYNGSKDTSKRIVRGGSFDLSNWASHCTYRYGFSPGTTIARTGLRIAL
jgi:formylglycine-generating enzyme required for sulfatase activity